MAVLSLHLYHRDLLKNLFFSSFGFHASACVLFFRIFCCILKPIEMKFDFFRLPRPNLSLSKYKSTDEDAAENRQVNFPLYLLSVKVNVVICFTCRRISFVFIRRRRPQNRFRRDKSELWWLMWNGKWPCITQLTVDSMVCICTRHAEKKRKRNCLRCEGEPMWMARSLVASNNHSSITCRLLKSPAGIRIKFHLTHLAKWRFNAWGRAST